MLTENNIKIYFDRLKSRLNDRRRKKKLCENYAPSAVQNVLINQSIKKSKLEPLNQNNFTHFALYYLWMLLFPYIALVFLNSFFLYQQKETRTSVLLRNTNIY